MRQTLPLILPDWTGHVPVCDSSLQKLTELLWLAEPLDRHQELHALLEIDPTLTLFLAVELLPQAKLSRRSLSGLSELASPLLSNLLAPHLNKIAPSQPNQPTSLSPDSKLDEAQTASLATRAVTTSRVVSRLAESHQCAEPAAFELAAHLICAAPLALHVEPSLTQQQLTEHLLGWIVETCHLPQVTSFCSLAETILAGANAPANQSTASAIDELLTGIPDLSKHVTSHWRAEVPLAFASLHQLVARLAPLEALQLEFHARLEEEKLLAMKELAYGAGHEINNPLANISVRAQTLIKQETDPERKRMLAAINGQVYRAHEMIADLMLFAQPPQLTPAPTDLCELIENLTKQLLPEAERQHTVLLTHSSAEPLLAPVDALQLSLALHAMVMNSLEALGRGGRIELLVQEVKLPKGRAQANIVVQDDGPGIPDDVRQHLFDPFYSGREAGRGLGFGLSKCWRIVTAHRGQIQVEHSPSGGAKFSIFLPLDTNDWQLASPARALAKSGSA